jgi:hypothetical protein
MLRPDECDCRDPAGSAALVVSGAATAAEVAATAIAGIAETEQPLSGVIATCFKNARHEFVGRSPDELDVWLLCRASVR